MRFVPVIAIFAFSATAQLIPGKYVVELQGTPMGSMARNRDVSAEARNRRTALDAEQKTARTAVEARGGKVLGSMRNIINAVAIDIPEEKAVLLSTMPGVKRIFPVDIATPALDHALPLHKVPQGWMQLGGMSKAGLGMKIAVLDTGITPKHPAFQDSSLTPPPGYPIVSGPENMSVVNNKIIVARNYAAYYQLTTPDSALDLFGHGTETADCAAGVTAVGPFATVTGAAPKAFLGIYKITPLDQETASSAVITAALDDAYGDGMDVVNLSFGASASLYNSIWNYALANATQLGMVVVTSAGNAGPNPNTVGNGADTYPVISVGATQSDRQFAGSVMASGLPSILASSGDYTTPNPPVTAPLADMSIVDPTNLGCGGALAVGSLTGAIVLTQTTAGCYYQTILNNAAAAGAVGVILYSGNRGATGAAFSPLAAKLPAVYIGNSDALALKPLVRSATVVTVTFEGVAVPNESRALATFSSRGPTDFSAGMKPDLSATGTFVYMATETSNPSGSLYHSSGFIEENGTSYASPIVAGSVALIKQNRPGLTMDQYRSLVINSVNPLVLPNGKLETLQRTGSGVLNLNAALSSTVTVYPTSLSAGTGGPKIEDFFLLTITNVGTQTETFGVRAIPYDAAPAPTFSLDGSNVFLGSVGGKVSVTLAPKTSKVVYVNWAFAGLPTGEYQGQIVVNGSLTGSTALVPYWYAYPDGVPEYLNTLGVVTQANIGTQVGLYFKVKDSTGAAITNNSILKVRSTVTKGDGTIQGPFTSTTYVNWLYLVATLSTTAGDNTFSFQVQGFTPISFTITGVKPSTIPSAGQSASVISRLAPAVEGENRPVQLQAIPQQ